MLEEVQGVVLLQRNSGLCVHDRGMSGAQCPEGYTHGSSKQTKCLLPSLASQESWS